MICQNIRASRTLGEGMVCSLYVGLTTGQACMEPQDPMVRSHNSQLASVLVGKL